MVDWQGEQTRSGLQLKPDEGEVLEGWVRAHGTPQQVAKRCRIVLLAHEGNSNVEIAVELRLNRHTCRLWRERFVAEGVESLWEVAEGRGRKPQPGLAERIVKATLASKPVGQTHWSSRTMAKAQGVDASTVCRIWPEHGLQPHRQETFELSRDTQSTLGVGARRRLGRQAGSPAEALLASWQEMVPGKRLIESARDHSTCIHLTANAATGQ